jgi:Spy/CpxP family protein refolding chaperone
MKAIILTVALVLWSSGMEGQSTAGRGGRGGAVGTAATGATAPAIQSKPPSPAAAQSRGGRGGAVAARGSQIDPYSQYFFAPEVVMRNQLGISLTDDQRAKIIREMADAQAKFTELQWTLSGEEEKLLNLIRQPSPPEQAVMAQMDRILGMEHNLKRTQMTLLVRVKNLLTAEQQESLTRLTRGGVTGVLQGGGRGGRGGGGGGGG